MKIYIWGTGFAAKELLETELSNVIISGFIDNNKNSTGFETIYPEEAVHKDYDAVIVATGYAEEIYSQAEKMGFDMSKFIFVYNNYFYKDMNVNYSLASKVFSSRYIKVMQNRYHVIRGMMQDEIKSSIFGGDRCNGMYKSDYNRLRMFEMIVEEINYNHVEGVVGELGVFKGEFARYINEAFPDRICYLFDTFDGFRKSEARCEQDEGNCGKTFIDHFKDTTKESVMQIMPYPEKIICKQGLFPESLEGLEEKFAFVSIDVDFEQSIYDGISYFYPRLSKGGYIFVHDYNSSTLRGVKKAIYRYEREKEVNLVKIPIPDVCGTLVITK